MHDELAELGARLIVRTLTERPKPVPQPNEGVTYAPKLSRDSGRIDWTRDARAIERQVRAFDPWPGSFTTLRGNMLKVLAAEPCCGSGEPGAVLDEHLTVACGTGSLRLTRVQLAGRPAMAAEDFLRGHAVTLGVFLGG
jgi:methionyl-tRNA formyltransferase